MKYTAKRRKLDYIRKKNHLRLGGLYFQIFRVANILLEQQPDYINLLTEEIREHLSKSFKMPIVSCGKDEVVYDALDFTRDLKTIRMEFKRDFDA